jgi:transcriptional regulator with XRE-family HTH domain
MGMSQERLGEAVNLTFQQIQKYERGANRIGASRLYQLAQALDVPVAFFFEGLTREEPARPRTLAQPPQESFDSGDELTRRETLELVRAYYRIANPELRRRLYELIKAVGLQQNNDEDE